MTDVKMPEPAYPADVREKDGEPCYTEAQLKQYGDDRAREALEMAADVVMMHTPRTGHSSPNWIRSMAMFDAIRALAKEIK